MHARAHIHTHTLAGDGEERKGIILKTDCCGYPNGGGKVGASGKCKAVGQVASWAGLVVFPC